MRVCILALLLVAPGCVFPDLQSTPRIVPGTGETEFIPLTAEADDLVLTNGVQGGTHIWGAVRVIGTDWRDVRLGWVLTDSEGDEVTESTNLRQGLNQCARTEPGCDPGMGEIVAVTLVVDSPSSVRGDELTLTVEAIDEEGRAATASSLVRPIFLVTDEEESGDQ